MARPKKKKKGSSWILPAVIGTTLFGLLFAALSPGGQEAIVSKVLDVTNMSIEQHLQQLHPAARERFRELIKRIEASGWKVTITSSYRSFAKQAALDNVNKLNADSGLSYHNYGLAIDINAVKGKDWLKKATARKNWEESGIIKIAKDLGFRWGGEFSNYYDPIHFDVGKQYPDKSVLLAIAHKQFGTNPVNIHGNQIKLAA